MKKPVATLLSITLVAFSCSSCVAHVHTFDMNAWEYDKYYHWHPATCGHQYAVEKTSHRFSKKVIAPTIDEQGYTTHTCSDCGYSYSDSWTYPLSETTFTVNWKNSDGSLLRSDSLLYGSLPEYKGSTPVKKGDTNGDYVFAGWRPEIHKVTSDQEYTATYRPKDELPTIQGSGNWRYMYIGSFQQTEYVPSSESETIELEKLFEEHGNPFPYQTPYQTISLYRVYQKMAGYTEGPYERRFFIVRPIRWDIIGEDENSYTLMSHQALEWRIYHIKTWKAGWENSEMRSYLNGQFLSHLEENGHVPDYILNTVNKNDYESCNVTLTADNYKDESGPTTDKVFLLSWEELGQLKDNGHFPSEFNLSDYSGKTTFYLYDRNVYVKYNYQTFGYFYPSRSPHISSRWGPEGYAPGYYFNYWALEKGKLITKEGVAPKRVPLLPVIRVSKS